MFLLQEFLEVRCSKKAGRAEGPGIAQPKVNEEAHNVFMSRSDYLKGRWVRLEWIHNFHSKMRRRLPGENALIAEKLLDWDGDGVEYFIGDCHRQ